MGDDGSSICQMPPVWGCQTRFQTFGGWFAPFLLWHFVYLGAGVSNLTKTFIQFTMLYAVQSRVSLFLSQNFILLLPSGKRLHNYGKSQFLMGQSTINGHFPLPEATFLIINPHVLPKCHTEALVTHVPPCPLLWSRSPFSHHRA